MLSMSWKTDQGSPLPAANISSSTIDTAVGMMSSPTITTKMEALMILLLMKNTATNMIDPKTKMITMSLRRSSVDPRTILNKRKTSEMWLNSRESLQTSKFSKNIRATSLSGFILIIWDILAKSKKCLVGIKRKFQELLTLSSSLMKKVSTERDTLLPVTSEREKIWLNYKEKNMVIER